MLVRQLESSVSSEFPTECQKYRIFGRIVFQIGVLHDDKVPGGFLKSATQSRALSHVLRLQVDPHLRVLLGQNRQDFSRTIARSVIHAKQFDFERHGEHALHYLEQRAALVVHRHDDRQFHEGKRLCSV